MTANRTGIAVERQLAALGCPGYEMILRQWTGPDDYYIRQRRHYTQAQILGELRALRRGNAQGCDVWIVPQPSMDQARLVLVDDLSREAITAMRGARITPAVVTETSTGNYQAWVWMPRRVPAIDSARGLCARYGGDPGAVGNGRQPGRLAGFTNRKPCHRRPDGRYPFVLLRAAQPDARPVSGIAMDQMRIGAGVIHFVEHHGPEEKTGNHAPPLGVAPLRGAKGGCAAGGRDTSASGRDWALACRMIAGGAPDQSVLDVLIRSAEQRAKRSAAPYAERTLRRARAHVCCR